MIGNAPWGQQTLTEPARKWAAAPEHKWETPNNQIGTLFLPKAAALTKPTGSVCLIQPAGSLLFNRNKPALDFRKHLFTLFKTEDVVNLSAIRFALFPKATGPACIVTITPQTPDGSPIRYWSPKQHFMGEGGHRIILDAHDLNWVYPQEAAEDPWVWTALAWGGRRDHELIRSMKSDPRRRSLESAIEEDSGWSATKGFERRLKNVQTREDRLNLRILEDQSLWDNCPLACDSSRFPLNENPIFGRPKELKDFLLPRLLMRLSWTVEHGRFKASLISSHDAASKHLLYSQSYFGISAPAMGDLAALALALNSIFAVYFFFLTGGRTASYRPTLINDDIEQFPLPPAVDISVDALNTMSNNEIDEYAFSVYGLKDSERALVEDFYNVTLQDFKGDAGSPGRQVAAFNVAQAGESILRTYCDSFLRVLRAGFGGDKPVSATIFHMEGRGATTLLHGRLPSELARS